MRTLILIASVTAMTVAGAAEPGKRPPSRASQAWATGPAPAPAAPPAAAQSPAPAAAVPAAPVAPAATSAAEIPARAPRSIPKTASLEPAVDTSADAAVSPSPRVAAAGTVGVRDRLELDTTQITGNRELPRVMYVVPWKRADLGDLAGKPVNSLLDEVLEPVDRDVFRRQNRYYQALRPDTGG